MAKETIKRANSKGVLTTYNPTKGNATVYPNYNFDAVMELVDKDPVARGAINHFIAKCMEGDYNIIKKDSYLYSKEEELRLEEQYNFRSEVLRKIFLMGKLFNNAFVEIVKVDHINSDGTSQKRTKALNVLDGSSIEAETKSNGDLISLKGKYPDPLTGEYPKWTKDEITWYKFNDMSKGYAPVDMKALAETLQLKSWVRRYVGWLWKTGQYRLLYNPKAASENDIEDFVAFLQRNDDDYQVPFIFKGELETKLLRDIKETESINNLLNYLDSQILILLRVPPVDAGITDASGRSSADQQSNNLITSITDMKKIVEDYTNHDLFKKISKSQVLLRFGPADRFAVKQVLEMVQIMKSMDMEDEVCNELMNDMGLYFKTDKVFKEPELDPIGAAAKNPRDKDQAPSRQGKGAGEGNKPAEEVTTRPDQLAKQ
jgi:hypothetical protein